jgi:hypothetical protein
MIGGIVLYALRPEDTEASSAGVRPAIVIQHFDDGSLSLAVITDGPNDGSMRLDFPVQAQRPPIGMAIPVWVGRSHYAGHDLFRSPGGWAYPSDVVITPTKVAQ